MGHAKLGKDGTSDAD